MLKNVLLGFGLAAVASFSTAAKAEEENFGCKALMCFAGGKDVSECQSTIREVKKRLAKGKGFPHCSFVNANGGNQDMVQQTGVFTRRVKAGQNCPDGTPSTRSPFGMATCKAITVTFKGANQDGSDMIREINW